MANPDDARLTAAKPTAAGTATVAPQAAPKSRTARPSAPATSAPKEKKKLEPNRLRRRLIWTAVWGYLAASFFMFLRFFFPRALFEPSTVHSIGYPSDFSLGVNEKYKQAYRIWVVKEPDRLFVIFARCVHLGCTPDWKPNENKFKCPCHGSGYTPEGINFEGPAPRPMDRAHVELDATGQIVVDTSHLFMWDRAKGGRDQFNDPGAFIPL
jgi:cytochrome b6-f complex iron-sulfur subunit